MGDLKNGGAVTRESSRLGATGGTKFPEIMKFSIAVSKLYDAFVVVVPNQLLYAQEMRD